jgi:hypothetical protein
MDITVQNEQYRMNVEGAGGEKKRKRDRGKAMKTAIYLDYLFSWSEIMKLKVNEYRGLFTDAQFRVSVDCSIHHPPCKSNQDGLC